MQPPRCPGPPRAAEAGGTYISSICARRCWKAKGRALRIHRASGEGSLAQELCALTHPRVPICSALPSPRARGAATAAPPDAAGPGGTWERSSASPGLPGQGAGGRKGGRVDAHKRSGCSPPARPAPGSCLGSHCFGQWRRKLMGTALVGEMGAWHGRDGCLACGSSLLLYEGRWHPTRGAVLC